MRNLAPFSNFVCLPTVIDAPGYYLTRGGETVHIPSVSTKHDFNNHGIYSNGVSEAWHKSGRLYFGQESKNDIVAKA